MHVKHDFHICFDPLTWLKLVYEEFWWGAFWPVDVNRSNSPMQLHHACKMHHMHHDCNAFSVSPIC